MEVGIVGLAGVGKTTLFRALTGNSAPGQRAGGSGAGGTSAAVGIANVPDPRLGTIASFIPTKKIIPATIRVVDLPGFATGGESSAFARQILGQIREVDAICHVVRGFTGLDGSTPAPASDIDTLETEMIFADLAIAEPAHDKAVRSARSNDREAKARLAALERVLPVLSDGKPIRSVAAALSPEERAAVAGYGMLTAKPVLFVTNIDETDIAKPSSPSADAVAQVAQDAGGEAVALCAKLEAELAELDESDRAEMLESLGLAEPALGVMARALYTLLGLTSFYTAGEKEVRAWPINAGASAPEAAGVIHSDIQRGFIRAECYHVNDLVQYKSEKAIKEAGKMRSEGKGYHMQDGDVVHFLFNV
ncbi:MAG: redox-regulated ATPase YchF [Phycisphaerales bacterium]